MHPLYLIRVFIMQEVRKPVVGYEWYYEVSNLWNVRSIKRLLSKVQKKRWWWLFQYNYFVWGKNISQHNIWGYKRVWLTKDTVRKSYLVHRLVYCSFNELTLDFKWFDKLVCHINDIWSDNKLNNLYLWTMKQNTQDCIRNWHFNWGAKKWQWLWRIHKKSSVELRSKVDMSIVNEIRSKYNNKNNLIEIWKIYWVSNATISRILSNKIWKV